MDPEVPLLRAFKPLVRLQPDINNNSMPGHTENVKVNQLVMENESLKQSLQICIEFKRILEHMFANPKITSDKPNGNVLTEYKAHFTNHLYKYRVYRKAFSDKLSGSIERIDDCSFTKCFSFDCHFSECKQPTEAFFIGEREDDEFIIDDKEKTDKLIIGQSDKVVTIATNEQIMFDHNHINPKTTESEIDIDANDSEIPVIQLDSDLSEAEIDDDSEFVVANGVLVENAVGEDITMNVAASNVQVVTSTRATTKPTVLYLKQSTYKRLVSEQKNIQDSSLGHFSGNSKRNKLCEKSTAQSREAIKHNSLSPYASFHPIQSSVTYSKQPLTMNSELLGSLKTSLFSSSSTSTKSYSPQVEPNNTTDTNNVFLSTSKSPDGMFNCKVSDCMDSFVTLDAATAHYNTHEKLFKCSKCPALFMSRRKVYIHFSVHDP